MPTVESIVYISFLASFFVMAFFWVLFSRKSLARIEREMQRDGYDRLCPWDGPGARTVFLGYAIGTRIGRSNIKFNPLIDVDLVNRYATPLDRKLARAHVLSSLLFALIGIIGCILLDL